MYKHNLQVWAEDLADADISQSNVNGDAVMAGGTNGGLVVNVIAESAVTVADTVAVTILQDDNQKGNYTDTLVVKNLPAGTYAKGDLIVQIGLPANIKTWLKGKVAGNSSSSGLVCVTLGYLAR